MLYFKGFQARQLQNIRVLTYLLFTILRQYKVRFVVTNIFSFTSLQERLGIANNYIDNDRLEFSQKLVASAEIYCRSEVVYGTICESGKVLQSVHESVRVYFTTGLETGLCTTLFSVGSGKYLDIRYRCFESWKY